MIAAPRLICRANLSLRRPDMYKKKRGTMETREVEARLFVYSQTGGCGAV